MQEPSSPSEETQRRGRAALVCLLSFLAFEQRYSDQELSAHLRSERLVPVGMHRADSWFVVSAREPLVDIATRVADLESSPKIRYAELDLVNHP